MTSNPIQLSEEHRRASREAFAMVAEAHAKAAAVMLKVEMSLGL